MTNKEATIAALQITGYSDSAIEKTLLDNGLNGDLTYDPSNSKGIDLIAIEILQGMLSVASVSEGGFSVSYSIPGIQARIDYLNAKNGITTGVPTVKGVDIW